MNKQGCSNILNPIALAQQPPPPRTPPPPPMRQHPRPPPPPPQATAAPPNTDQRRIPARSSQDGHRRGGAGRVSGGRLHHHALPVRKVDRKTKDRYHGPQENLEACSSPQEKTAQQLHVEVARGSRGLERGQDLRGRTNRDLLAVLGSQGWNVHSPPPPRYHRNALHNH